MIFLICLILIIWAIDGLCANYDHEEERIRDYRRAERRHKEMLEVMKKQKRRTRTVAEKDGVKVAQEVMEYK